MAVEVSTPTRNGQNPTLQHDGDAVDVRDGHLFILNGVDTSAVYAPGLWIRAEVVKK